MIKEILLQCREHQLWVLNIFRSLNKNRHVEIFYVYQDPLVAWAFTKAREILEGRNVPKEIFVKSLFKAKENVNRIKLHFGDKIGVNVILKNLENGQELAYNNVESVDEYVNISYTKSSLFEKL